MIYRWKHPSRSCHLWGILQGFGELADGLVTLLTLAHFSSSFELSVSRRRARHYFVRRKTK
jgi:hypothetical protein